MSSAGGEKKGKEIKFETRHVITRDQVLKNERLMKTLLTINLYGDISEKALHTLVHDLKEAGIDLGYSFLKIGNVITSKQLKDDVISLLYVDFIESVGRAKKFRVTGMGKEALEQFSIDKEFLDKLKKKIEELRPKIAAIDAEVELSHRGRRRF